MSDRNDNSSLQGMFAQVLREIQSGINRLEQTVQAQQQPHGSNAGPGAPSSRPAQAESAPPKEPAAPYTGQRYEYKVAFINFRGQISSEGQQIIIGRGERRSTFVRQYLDELGQQGWELSGVSPLENENSYFVFKRPASGPATVAPDAPASSTTAGSSVQVEEIDEDQASTEL